VSETPSPRATTVLVVDDDPDVRETLADAVEDAGRRVLMAQDGAEALRTLDEAPRPCLVLLDLKMPKVDGIEVLRQIKGDPLLQMIPVVMMTSSREEHDLLNSYQLGVNAYVVKPMTFHDLIDAVKQVGGFWAVTNEPPPGSLCRPDRPRF